jgi:hypothetical protein
MKIKFIEHARERMTERGASEEEVRKVLLFGTDIEAKRGRKAREMILLYGEKWMGRVYPEKKIVVIYKKEKDEILVITVKVFYGQWRKI